MLTPLEWYAFWLRLVNEVLFPEEEDVHMG